MRGIFINLLTVEHAGELIRRRDTVWRHVESILHLCARTVQANGGNVDSPLWAWQHFRPVENGRVCVRSLSAEQSERASERRRRGAKVFIFFLTFSPVWGVLSFIAAHYTTRERTTKFYKVEGAYHRALSQTVNLTRRYAYDVRDTGRMFSPDVTGKTFRCLTVAFSILAINGWSQAISRTPLRRDVETRGKSVIN